MHLTQGGAGVLTCRSCNTTADHSVSPPSNLAFEPPRLLSLEFTLLQVHSYFVIVDRQRASAQRLSIPTFVHKMSTSSEYRNSIPTSEHTMDAETRPKRCTITVLYFAAASTATGKSFELIELPIESNSGFPLSQLSSLLEAQYPNTDIAKVLKTSRWSVDAEMVEEEAEGRVFLKGGEEVAVICPVSGG